jgi:PAS domain S-box-containing protein
MSGKILIVDGREVKSLPKKSIRTYSRIGLQLLVSIACTELLIMTSFRLIRIEAWLPPLLIDLTDTLLLCVIASFLILHWVVKPMKIMEEREKAKEAIASMARFPEENPGPVMRFSFDGTLLYANQASLCLKKLWNSELGQKVPDDVASSVMDVCGTGVSKEVEVVCGETIFSLILACIKNAQYVNVYGSDITKRKLMEDDLQYLTLRYKAILAAIPDIITEVDSNKIYTWANKAGYEFFGDDVIGKEAAFYFEGEQQTYNIIQPLFKGNDEIINVESLQRRKDGEKRLLTWWCRVLKDSEGNVTGVLSTAKDITEYKRAEVERDRLVAIIETTTDLISFADPTGHILYLNPAARALLGVGVREDITSTSIADFIPDPVTHPILTEGLPTAIRQGMWSSETVLLNRGGHKFPVSQVILAHKTAEGKLQGLSTIMRDITERKHLEAQLRQAQKMEAVGTLAGGIAHDFNNILNVIMGYGNMVMDTLAADSPAREDMHEVLVAADKAADLTKRLLVFSRKKVVEVTAVNINTLILGLQKMLARIIRENIEFRSDLADSPLVVMADAGQLEQVLINLASNAKDAMPEGGRLTISTGLQVMDDEYVAAYGYGKPGEYALITVADTGQGMDAETQIKIFEPFFTTKGIGEGTGLGLAISYEIIKQHNGYIKVYSEPGNGTAFKIYLPLSAEAALDKKAADAAPVKGGDETVLVAEDDAALRKLSRVVLESFGYTVITAENGEDALAKFMENRESIDLVLLDMIMPKKNGKEVAEAIRKVCPKIKILFASGYTMEIISTKELLADGFNFIQKPYQSKGLLMKVREVLDK